MPRILNFGGVFGFSSMLSLTTRSLSLYSVAIVSRIGAIILQGPHHSAQKSSSTGWADFTTSCSKAASVVCTISPVTFVESSDFGPPQRPLEADRRKSIHPDELSRK